MHDKNQKFTLKDIIIWNGMCYKSKWSLYRHNIIYYPNKNDYRWHFISCNPWLKLENQVIYLIHIGN